MLDRRDELDAFKREISLVEYAASRGYDLNRRASGRCCAVMANPDGDKVVVAVGKDGHWTYFSVRDDQDNETIIDFVQRRQGGSLGEVRRTLRALLGFSSPAPPGIERAFPRLEPASKDIIRVEARLAAMTVSTTHDYLVDARAIPPEVLLHERFAGRIRMDAHGNAVFPHWKDGSLCGFELKNQGFTGFSAGGAKVLWLINGFEADNALVVTKSAIDALSYFSLRRPATYRYASIGGSMNPTQPERRIHRPFFSPITKT